MKFAISETDGTDLMKYLEAMSTLAAPFVLFAPACDQKDGNTENAPDKGATKAQTEAEPLPAVDARAAADALAAIASAPEEAQSGLAMKSLVKIEEQRLGKSFVGGWHGVATAPPDMRLQSAAPAISENPAMFEAACNPDVSKTFQAIDAAAPEQQMDLLWTTCDLARHGFMTREQAEGADVSAVLLTHMAFVHIQARGGTEPNERKLLERAAQLPATPPALAAE